MLPSGPARPPRGSGARGRARSTFGCPPGCPEEPRGVRGRCVPPAFHGLSFLTPTEPPKCQTDRPHPRLTRGPTPGCPQPLSHAFVPSFPPGTAPKPQPPCAGARDKPRCTAGGIPSPASARFSNGMGDAPRMGCGGGAFSGAPQRKGTDPDGSSWLTPRTPRPQAWQPSGAPGTERPLGLLVPGPTGPMIALRRPPEPQGCPSPQRCLLSLGVPGVPVTPRYPRPLGAPGALPRGWGWRLPVPPPPAPPRAAAARWPEPYNFSFFLSKKKKKEKREKHKTTTFF